jgi:phosphoenolpyruvate carboxylase
VGLFGYARSIGRIKLPRVISFCAACYSIGLPPEILGLNALSKDEMDYLKTVYVNLDFDMKTAMSYFNEDVFALFPAGIKKSLAIGCCEYETSEEHENVTSRIIKAIKEDESRNLQTMIVEAAHIRRFLG